MSQVFAHGVSTCGPSSEDCMASSYRAVSPHQAQKAQKQHEEEVRAKFASGSSVALTGGRSASSVMTPNLLIRSHGECQASSIAAA